MLMSGLTFVNSLFKLNFMLDKWNGGSLRL